LSFQFSRPISYRFTCLAPYNFFTVDPSVQKQSLYKDAAEGITVMKLNKNEIQRINSERPEALEMNFPFE